MSKQFDQLTHDVKEQMNKQLMDSIKQGKNYTNFHKALTRYNNSS